MCLLCLSLLENTEAKTSQKGKDFRVQWTSFYDLDIVSVASSSLWNPSQCKTSCRYPRPAGPVIPTKSSDWLFPMSETSAPAGRRYSLLICTRFHGSGAAHSSFCKGGVQSGTNGITYASGNSCGSCPLLATAHILHTGPEHSPVQNNTSLLQIKRAQLKHWWKLSGDTDQSLPVGPAAADG